ncbi:hypothetical protein BC829DRAFT_46649 [Chytridium lagenaria]|nr:hypothetical protein BC829DRAFT_46649 [Chytridium lagenaria]
MELLHGSAIINLAGSGVYYNNDVSIRLDAINRFSSCIRLASSGNLCLPELIQALEMCQSTLQDKIFTGDRSITLPLVESITKTLSGAYFKNPKFHEALVADVTLQKLVVFTYYYCIDIYSETSNWQMALQTIEKLLRLMPPSMHPMLAKRKLQILSESGKTVALTFLKDADLKYQIHIWRLLARKASLWKKKNEAYIMLIEALKSSTILEFFQRCWECRQTR